MSEKKKKNILILIWALVAVSVLWFFISGLNIYALFMIFLLTAVALLWQALYSEVTEKMRRRAFMTMNIFWTVIAFLMFFPFPAPDPPEYIVGEVHRFSEPNHGWGRMYWGQLGPNLVNHGYVYTHKDLIEPMAKARGGSKPSFTTTYPLARATFGISVLTDSLRAPDTVGGEPVHPMKYPWTSFEGTHRSEKIGWNNGDLLLGNVAGKVGYEKAKYTPEENALMVKEIGLWLGSEAVGICRIDPRWFYSHDFLSGGTPLSLEDVKDLKYGIQVFTDQNWRRVLNDPGESWWSASKSGTAYSTSAFIAIRLAQMLRDMGFEARVGHGGVNYETIESVFSIYNGMGEHGRLSNAVVPAAGGLRFKTATILTSFPMEPDTVRNSYGVTRFCEHCDRCARACPVNAIPMGEPTVENGIKMWHVDKDKCVRFRAGNLNGNCCNECLKVCPYNKPDNLFHKLGSYMTKHSFLAPWLFGDVRAVGLEDWLAYQYSTAAGDFGKNRPARWIQENPGYKIDLPRQVGKYIYTEEDRSTAEEWATGVGAEMGKVGLKYKGIEWGKIPERLLDENGRNRNVHWDYDEGELGPDVQNIGRTLTEAEAQELLKSGKAFTGGWYKKHEDVYPPRSDYEKQVMTYKEASEKWAKE